MNDSHSSKETYLEVNQSLFELVAAAFVTSAVSGAIGMAGGMMLLIFMSGYFPVSVLIPLHGCVQLVSNSTRVWLFRKNIHRSLTLSFLVGVILGAIISSRWAVAIPEDPTKIAIAIFILVFTWLPKFKSKFKLPFSLLGFVASSLSLILGATGPLIAPFFLGRNLTKQQIVGTKAICQMQIHMAKILLFGFLGFSFSKYWVIVVSMSAAVYFGTRFGKAILSKIPEKYFKIVFKLVITFFALRILSKYYY